MNLKKGDMVWVEVKGAPSNFGYGEVFEVWKEEEVGEVFTFFCEVNGGLRMGYFKNIIEKPNARMTSKLLEEKKAIIDILKKKKII